MPDSAVGLLRVWLGFGTLKGEEEAGFLEVKYSNYLP